MTPAFPAAYSDSARPPIADDRVTMAFENSLPSLYIPEGQHRRLDRLVRSELRAGHPVAPFLEAELARAFVGRSEDIPLDAVTMGSRVVFSTGPGRILESRLLVYPEQYLPSGHYLSVLSPLGAAMLGLREGNSMPFRDLAGAAHVVSIEEVAFQPEADNRHWTTLLRSKAARAPA